ncbi:Ankyrin repeat domain-containing protein 53 [Mactra antiquata]
MRLKTRLGTEMSNLTAISEMDSVRNAARMRAVGNNPGISRGGWGVTAKTPSKPYLPILKDVYPRNEYTMMPSQNGPKYFTGHFIKYDYKDAPQQPQAHNDGRPVVFKKQDIENVQTKKKYGQNLKGQSSVPLHLCNDTNSLLYQRSLQPETRFQSTDGSSSYSSGIYTPFALHKQTKNEVSALHPLRYNDPTQTWINTSYISPNRRRLNSNASRSTLYGLDDEFNKPKDSERLPRNIKSAPEWYSDFFPRQKVADAMKFMGEAKQSTQSSARNKEFDVNFNGTT